jgi:hypothetical protein
MHAAFAALPHMGWDKGFSCSDETAIGLSFVQRAGSPLCGRGRRRRKTPKTKNSEFYSMRKYDANSRSGERSTVPGD